MCLFLTTVGYHHSHSFFYALWLVFGGLSAAKLVSDVTLRVNSTMKYTESVVGNSVRVFVNLDNLVLSTELIM